MRRPCFHALIAVVLAGCLQAQSGAVTSQEDGPLAEFFAVRTAGERAEVAASIIAAGTPFDEVLGALRRGRSYSNDVPRGVLLREHKVNGVRHPYTIIVPVDYSPEQKLPVRVHLHGGMGAKEWKELDGSWAAGWTRTSNQIAVFPAGWWDSMWWEASQVQNIEAILNEVRSTWNIEENRVVLTGNSDGGAALFFQAMRSADRWAGYLGHVAPPDRLRRKDFRIDGQMHLSNLSGQTFLLGFGEKDKLVPLRYIEKYMQLFEGAGARLEWYVLKGQGHDLKLPEERLQRFVDQLWGLERDPLPDELSWATEAPDRYGRRSWLVIEELGQNAQVDQDEILPRFGTRLQLRGPSTKPLPWGRVSLQREGNRVTAEVVNVARFKLLISPDEFDLAEPIRVEVGGELVFDGRVKESLATLLSFAAMDDDRHCLFAAAIDIAVESTD